jgi:hypothetical protein
MGDLILPGTVAVVQSCRRSLDSRKEPCRIILIPTRFKLIMVGRVYSGQDTLVIAPLSRLILKVIVRFKLTSLALMASSQIARNLERVQIAISIAQYHPHG